MMFQPKLSVVIPVYNVEKYLRPCLDSALAQTLQAIEIICVDDGSTDSCPALLDEYARKDSRVKVIHKANGGYGQAVNTGMDAARGEYFAILESDDWIPPTMYQRLYTLAKELDLDVIKADFERFVTRPDGSMQTVYAPLCADASLYNRVIENEPAKVLYAAGLYTWSGIYRLDFLRQNDIRHNETPGASYQDNGFWFQTMSLAPRVYFLREAFYQLRRDNPESSIKSTAKVYCIRDEYEFISAFLSQRPTLRRQTLAVYWWARLVNYRTTYRRVAMEYKADFARHFAETVRAAQPELDWALFTPAEAADLQLLLTDWAAFHRKNKRRTVRDPMQASRFTHLCWYVEDFGLMAALGRAVRKVLH